MAIICIAILLFWLFASAMANGTKAEALYEEDLKLRRLLAEQVEYELKLKRNQQNLESSIYQTKRITEEFSRGLD